MLIDLFLIQEHTESLTLRIENPSEAEIASADSPL
jgi:hypothetical protein